MTWVDEAAAERLAEPPDLRLVPAACGSWAVAVLGLVAGWVPAGCVAAAAALLCLVAGARAARGRYPASAGVLAAAACVASVGFVVAGQVQLVSGHPMRQAATRGEAATVRVVLSGDPAPVWGSAPTGYGGQAAGAVEVSVPAQLVTARVAGTSWQAGGRVLLIAPVAGWSGLLPGTELTASGLLSPASRPDLTVAVLRVRGPPTQLSPPPWWQRGAGVLRDGLRRASGVLPDRSAQLLPGLAVGDTSAMSWTLREEFRTTGLTHLTAVSGGNLVFVVGAVVGLLALCRVGPRARALGAVLALVGFVVLARPSPSVLRAAVMGGVGVLAVWVGRRRSALPALAASVIALLLVDPALGTDPGFVLSVLATGALVLVAPGWAAWLRRRGAPPGVAEALAVPAAAHLVTAPVVAGLSGQFSLVAVLANMLVAPVVAPITVLGVLAALVSPLSMGLAQLCVRLAGPEVAWLVTVAHWGAGVPGGALGWPSGVVGALALTGALGVAWLLLRRRRIRALLVAVLLGALLVLVPTRFVRIGWPPRDWAMVACDVGQGDALVLATGQPGTAVLVDTGTETGAVDGCLTRLGVRSLALVVLTHLHADHIGGLAQALAGRAAAAIAVGPVRRPASALDSVRRVAVHHRVPLVGLSAGQRLVWPSLDLRVLGPATDTDEAEPAGYQQPGTDSAVNNTSLVIRAGTPAGVALLTGDAELLAQSQLMTAGVDVRADILKMPHHGSRTTSPDFLAEVRPRLVLVSVGAGNPYHHPDPGELDRLRLAGALVQRTDQGGDIAVVAGPAAVARGDPLPAPRHGNPRAR